MADSEQWAFYFDPEQCIGCHACAISCKNSNDVDVGGVDWRRVTHVGTGEFPDYEETTLSISCMHCGNPPCEKVCPTGAIEKRESDGVVTVDREKCIGCRYCGFACPYGAPQYDDEGLMQKCHMCLGHGPGAGNDAAPKGSQSFQSTTCVETCVGEALDAGPVSEMVEKAGAKAAEQYAGRNSANVIVEGGEELSLD